MGRERNFFGPYDP
uniref:Uncharacterized protein n=1 Tax=Rhizophora mucronata TaxID=61149 RepID=A0A2P2Q1N0_RHIMU